MNDQQDKTRGTCECPECRIVLHMSDCAVHNEPAEPIGPCDCKAWLRRSRKLISNLLAADWAFERSPAKGGPELEVAFSVAHDALDDHLEAWQTAFDAATSAQEARIARLREALQGVVKEFGATTFMQDVPAFNAARAALKETQPTEDKQ